MVPSALKFSDKTDVSGSFIHLYWRQNMLMTDSAVSLTNIFYRVINQHLKISSTNVITFTKITVENSSLTRLHRSWWWMLKTVCVGESYEILNPFSILKSPQDNEKNAKIRTQSSTSWNCHHHRVTSIIVVVSLL